MSKAQSFRNILFLVFCLSVGVVFALQNPAIKSKAKNLFNLSEKINPSSANILSPSPSPTPEQTHNLVAAFYDVQNYPSAKLLLNNKGLEAKEVRPTLYNLEGNILEVAPVMVEANSHRFINLSDWANLGGASFQKGSLKLFHTGKDLIIGSQIYLEDSANSLSFEERLAELGKFDSRRLEAIWHMPRNQTQATIILSNTSDNTISVTARLSKIPHQSGEAQIISLLPHQTRVLDLRNDFPDGNNFANGKIVGLSLEYAGEKSALKAHGQIKDAPKGYSNIISFTNPNTGKSNELHGTGLHLGAIGSEELDPVVAVKNVGTSESNVTAKVPYTRADGTTGTVNINSINLKVGEMRLLNMNSVIQRSRQEQIKIAGLEISYDTAPGSVLVQAQSVSENLNKVFRVPMAEPLAQTSSTGGYPWRLENTSRTVAYIKNMTDVEQEYMAYFIWENGGEYAIGLKKIAAHKSIEIDIKQLRDEQTPDFRGRTIPLNLTGGQIKWSLLRRHNTGNKKTDELALIGRSEQIDTANSVSSSYACQNCCSGGEVDAFITTDPSGYSVPSNYNFEIGEFVQFYGFVDFIDCYGNLTTSFAEVADWDSDNENVATVNSNGGVEIIAVGEVEIDADIYGYFYFGYEPCGPYLVEEEVCDDKSKKETGEDSPPSAAPCGSCDGQQQHFEPGADISVKPKISGITPDRSVVNRVVDVSINGSGFAAGATVQVSGSGITVSDVSVASANQITAKFTVASNAAQGERNVTVTVNNKISNSKKFLAQVPNKLEVVLDTGNVTVANCSGTVKRDIVYKLIDQDNKEIRQAVDIIENLSNVTTNSCGNGQPSLPGCAPTEPPQQSGQPYIFGDSISINYACQSSIARRTCQADSSCGYTYTQKWKTCGNDGNIQLFSVPGSTLCNEIKINNSTLFLPGTRPPNQ